MRLLSTISIVLILAGCCTPGNLRHRMEQAASLPEGVQQTQFAYVGDIQTDSGSYHVATQRRVLTGMLAPRGLPNRLLLFDKDARLVAVYEYLFNSAEPLWCEGSRVYLFGNGTFRNIKADARLAGITNDAERPTGNVIDFADGPDSPRLTREKRYGSSGGIEDDPWQVGTNQRLHLTGNARD